MYDVNIQGKDIVGFRNAQHNIIHKLLILFIICRETKIHFRNIGLSYLNVELPFRCTTMYNVQTLVKSWLNWFMDIDFFGTM